MLKRAAEDGTETPTAIVGSAFTVVADALLGGDITQFAGEGSALDELIDVTDMRGLAEDEVAGVGAIIPGGREELQRDLVEIFKCFSFSVIADTLETATFGELPLGPRPPSSNR